MGKLKKMKLTELKSPYRELAEMRHEQQKETTWSKEYKKDFDKTNEICFAFLYEMTNEGDRFWYEVDRLLTRTIPQSSLDELTAWQEAKFDNHFKGNPLAPKSEMNAKELFFKKYGTEITVETHPAYYVNPRVFLDLMEEYAEAKAKEAWNAAIDAAAYKVSCGKCEMLGLDAPCDEHYYGGNIKLKAILNLKK